MIRLSQRGRVRDRQDIPGGCVTDVLTVVCCAFCSLIQEAQEINVMMGGSMAQDIERT